MLDDVFVSVLVVELDVSDDELDELDESDVSFPLDDDSFDSFDCFDSDGAESPFLPDVEPVFSDELLLRLSVL